MRGAIALEPRRRAPRHGRAQRRRARRAGPRHPRCAARPKRLRTLPAPDAIFIGGGLSRRDDRRMRSRALKPGGRLVAHAVTLESEALLLAAYAGHGGELVRLSVARAEPLGAFPRWRPADAGHAMGVEKAVSGRLYGIGVGPGDPELMTLKAVRILARGAGDRLPGAERGESSARAIAAEFIPAGPHRDRHPRADAAGPVPARGLRARRRRRSPRISTPAATSACSARAIRSSTARSCICTTRSPHRFPLHVVPGVSSLTACAAASGRPLVRRDDVLTVLPATLADAELERRLASTDAAAILKVGRHLARLKALLARLGLRRLGDLCGACDARGTSGSCRSRNLPTARRPISP